LRLGAEKERMKSNEMQAHNDIVVIAQAME
jgi:hypothetical protein